MGPGTNHPTSVDQTLFPCVASGKGAGYARLTIRVVYVFQVLCKGGKWAWQ